MTKKRIGITCRIDDDGGLGLFSNGVRQAALFLYRMFKKNGHTAFLITGPDSVPLVQTLESFGITKDDMVSNAEVDVLIVVSRKPSLIEWASYKRIGTKVILYKGGQNGIGSMEALCRQGAQDTAETYEDAANYDAVWLPAHYGHAYKSWCEIVYRCPVLIVPPTWEPLFLPPNFGWRPPADLESWRLAVMEPNNTVTRTAHVPLLAIRAACTGSAKIGEITVLNAAHLDGNPHFDQFLRRLLLKHDNPVLAASMLPRLHLAPRIVGPVFMAERCDMLVTHDWENSLNYLYFEALYGGYPLVHASPYLREHGYHYDRWSAGEGGLRIREAMDRHDPVATKQAFESKLMPQLQSYAHHEAFL